MTAAPEFFRPRRLDTIGTREEVIEVEADARERHALALRFGLLAIDRLVATIRLHREGDGVVAEGKVIAAVVQPCSVTDDPVPAHVEEPFSIRFVPEQPGGGGGEEELELDEQAMDTVFFSGGAIDLGEAAAETLALALDPYPRSPRAAEVLREAGVVSEEEAGPFGGLAAIRDALARRTPE